MYWELYSGVLFYRMLLLSGPQPRTKPKRDKLTLIICTTLTKGSIWLHGGKTLQDKEKF